MVFSTKKKVYTEQPEVAIRVCIDRKTGDYDTYRFWTVVADEDHEMPACQKAISDLDENEYQIGDVIEEQIESIEFGRIAATQAKQVIIQKIREAERALVADAFEARVGELITGEVKKQSRDGYVIDLGDGAEGYLPKDQALPRENLRPKSRVTCLLSAVNRDNRGSQILLSRASKDMLKALMTKEVPEISEGIIEIRDVARLPGLRAKISVKTHDNRIDPVGACIGMRGTRIQAVQQELDGERIDVVVWSDDPAQYIISSLEPADVSSIVLDEDNQTADIIFGANDQLARAIGSQGQNVRLASDLTGYKLDMMLESEYAERQKSEAGASSRCFMSVWKWIETLPKRWQRLALPPLKKWLMCHLRPFMRLKGLMMRPFRSSKSVPKSWSSPMSLLINKTSKSQVASYLP